MDLSSPLLDVVPTVRGALLQALVRFETPVTRRQLAAAADVAPGNASTVVQDLIDTGLVNETVAGRSSMVSLNRSHLAAAPVTALAELRGELIRRLRGSLSAWPDLQGAWLFGSVARGDADRDSDIDVLIVATGQDTSKRHERLTVLHTDVRAWTGNELQLVEHTSSSWRRLVRDRNPLVDQIRTDGVLLAGDRSPLARSR